MTTPPAPKRAGRPGAISAIGLTGAPAAPAPIGSDVVTSRGHEATTSRPRGVTSSRSHDVTAPQQSPQVRGSAPAAATAVSYTLRLAPVDADALDDLVRALGREAGRRRLDKSELIRALLDLTRTDDDVRARLLAALRRP